MLDFKITRDRILLWLGEPSFFMFLALCCSDIAKLPLPLPEIQWPITMVLLAHFLQNGPHLSMIMQRAVPYRYSEQTHQPGKNLKYGKEMLREEF